MAKEEKVEKTVEKDLTEDFIARKLKAINEMASPAKKRTLSVKVLSNRK